MDYNLTQELVVRVTSKIRAYKSRKNIIKQKENNPRRL